MPATFTEDHLSLLEETSDATRELAKDLKTIRKELLSKEERGSKPDDETVLDLEKRLEEAEGKVDAAVSLLEKSNAEKLEEMRSLILAQAGGANGSGEKRIVGDGILGDWSHVKDQVREWAGLDHRADLTKAEQRALTSATTIATAGRLQPETAQEFMDWIVQVSAVLSRIEVLPMSGPVRNLDRLDDAAEGIRAKTEDAEATKVDAISAGQRVLTSVPVYAAMDLTLEFLEDNIERANGQEHILRLLTTKFGNGLANSLWNADTTHASAWLAHNDGVIKFMETDGDVIDDDHSSETAILDVFSSMLAAMPSQYRTLPDMGLTVPVPVAENYANTVSARATALGDDVLVNGFPALRYFGVPVYPEPYFTQPVAAATQSDNRAVLTPNSNLVVGIQRQLSIDTEFKPRFGRVELTLSARVDFQYKWGGIIVLGDDIPVALGGGPAI